MPPPKNLKRSPRMKPKIQLLPLMMSKLKLRRRRKMNLRKKKMTKKRMVKIKRMILSMMKLPHKLKNILRLWLQMK